MIDKSVSTLSEAIAGIHDGATIMIGGFGPAGQPTFLIDALIDQGARDLTIINNNAGNGEVGLAALLKAGRVRKMICSFPRQVDSQIFDDLYRRGKVELELVALGDLDPENIITPGIFVQRVFSLENLTAAQRA
ncbi:3-oxoacid CoA-transferase subunit A [Klebsiella pneumoniae]